MNNRTLITSALLALGLISQAGAANVVYITGSTAFPSQSFLAIKASFHGAAPDIAARRGSAVDGSNGNFMLFHGNVGGAETFIDCFWSGSEAGIAAVAQPGSHPTFYLKTDGTVSYTISSSNPTATELNSTASTS